MKTNYHLLTEEQEDLRQMVHEFADKELIPNAAAHDVAGTFMEREFKLASEMGLTTFMLPTSVGGGGGSNATWALIKEELARGDAGFASTISACYMSTVPLKVAGNELQQKQLADVLLHGGISSFALTEADAGSDSAAIKTKYVKDGSDYILNGRKSFITNGGLCDMFICFATKDPSLRGDGISVFLVDAHLPGISRGKHEDKMGMRTSNTADIVMEDVRVPASALIGEEGKGLLIAKNSLNFTRPSAGAAAIGNALFAMEYAAEYSKIRVTFGKPICKNQGVSFLLADMYTKLEAARQLTWHVCRCADSHIFDPRLASAAKCFAADVGMQVTTDCVQIMGGNGYSREYPVEKRMRDAKIFQIFEGTNQIQRKIISGDILHS